MSDKHTKILLMEDNPGDARLIQEMLAEAEPGRFDLACADQLSAGIKRLEQGGIDVILLDLGLPDSQGFDTFTKVYAQAQKTPIVVFTGLVDKAVGIKAVRGGAQDYLVKGQVDGNLISRSINHAIERKQAEELYRTLANSSPVGIYIVQDGKFQFVNSQFRKYTGYSEDELLGRDSLSIVHPEDRQRVRENAVQMLKGKRLPPYEFRAICKDGETIWAMETAVSIQYRGKRATLGNFMDITERKQMEEELRVKDNAIASSINAIAMADLGGNLTYVNYSFLKMWGYDSDKEVLGKPATGFWEVEEKASEVIDALTNTGSWLGELTARKKDGSTFDAQLSASMVTDGNGEATCMMASFADITERKRAQERVRESRRRFIELADLLPQSVWEMDNKGNFTFINRQGFQARGYTPEDFAQGSSPPQAIVPEDQARVQEQFQRVWKGEEVGGIEYTEVRKDGSTFPVITFANPITRGNRTVGLRGVTVDITERKRMEEALRESNRRFSDIAVNALEWIWEVDANGKYTYASPVVEKILGYKPEEVLKQHFYDPFHPDEREELKKAAFEVFAKKQPFREFVNRNIHKNGKTVWLSTSGVPILDEDGNLFGYRGVDIDITERKRLELELRQRNEQLQARAEELITRQQELMEKTREVEKANRLKSEFLANMSHELRTPLNVIIGFSELMRDEVPGKVNEEQRQCLSDILDSSQRLLTLINDVLDLSKVESGRMELKRENVVLTEVTESLTRTMMPLLTPRKQSLDIEIEEGLPPVYVDASKLRQVLLNLVDNSSRFTPDGSKLKIEAVREGDWCQVSVIDDGIGIENDDQERIFEPFCQVGNPLTREKGGTGLGLPLVKQIVQRYGGRIWVESEYGQGSRFIFTLPLARSG